MKIRLKTTRRKITGICPKCGKDGDLPFTDPKNDLGPDEFTKARTITPRPPNTTKFFCQECGLKKVKKWVRKLAKRAISGY